MFVMVVGWKIEQCAWIFSILLAPKSDDSSDFDLTSSVGYAGGFDAAIAIAGEIDGVDREAASWLSGLF